MDDSSVLNTPLRRNLLLVLTWREHEQPGPGYSPQEDTQLPQEMRAAYLSSGIKRGIIWVPCFPCFFIEGRNREIWKDYQA